MSVTHSKDQVNYILTTNISQMVADNAKIAVAIKYEVLDVLLTGIFAFDFGQF